MSSLRAAIETYQREGFARLGVLADEATLDGLRARVDAIMLGEVVYDGLFFQHDAESGRYEDLPYGEGWQGPSLRYRKLEKLEKDPLFRAWLSRDEFRAIAEEVYGPTAIALYRAFVMNKHAGGGTALPWHQDGGAFWGLDREPVLQIWTAIDDAPEDGGCLEFVPRSHLRGLATPNGGVVPRNFVDAADAEANVVRVPARAGEVVLIHNHVWHRSGQTNTGRPRRAFSACYMDARTQCRRKKRAPREFFQVWPGRAT